jgi:UDP-3-O-[3-hydroxymyristoyl] N-acetylglucosamine deacetylase
MEKNQYTIQQPCTLQGIGLLFGNISDLTLLPAAEDTGIVFLRKDSKSEKERRIKATLENASCCNHEVYLVDGDTEIHLIEHLLAAIWLTGIDNLYIKISSCEVPICDGSALPFMELILEAGLKKQNKLRSLKRLHFPKLYKIQEKDGYISFCRDLEEEALSLEYHFISKDREEKEKVLIKRGEKETIEYFLAQISPAHTFISQQRLRSSKTHFQGGNLDNALILGESSLIINNYNSRLEKELVKHKIIDLIGDLALLPCSFNGISIYAKNTSHKLHIQALQNLSKKLEK